VTQRSSVNSSRAAREPNRPQPLAPTPPKGICGSSCTVAPLMWQIRLRGGFGEHALGDVDVEHAPRARGAHFPPHQRRQLAQQDGGGFENLAPARGWQRRPFLQRAGSRRGGRLCVHCGRSGDPGDRLPGQCLAVSTYRPPSAGSRFPPMNRSEVNMPGAGSVAGMVSPRRAVSREYPNAVRPGQRSCSSNGQFVSRSGF
jgi:hypothetical protein